MRLRVLKSWFGGAQESVSWLRDQAEARASSTVQFDLHSEAPSVGWRRPSALERRSFEEMVESI